MSSASSAAVVEASRLCACCGHAKVSHYSVYDSKTNTTSAQCGTMVDTTQVPYTRCACKGVCEGYEPSEGNAWICKCGSDFVTHEDVRKEIASRLQRSDDPSSLYDHMEVAYKVYPTGLLRCCLVTIYNYMREHQDPWGIPVGTTIRCAHCQKSSGSCIEVVDEKDFYFGPVFRFKWEGGK